MRTASTLAAVAAAAVGQAAPGQANTFNVLVSNVISPDQPSATVEVWTTWDADQYAFAGAAFDLIGASDPGGFSNPERMLKGPGTKNGEVAPDGDSVIGIVSGQLHGIGGIFADTANPILVWRATWTTSDFAARIVDLSTVTSKYNLYINYDGTSKSFLDEFVEGVGAIQVVPAPPALAIPVLALAMGHRRSRRR